VPRCADLGIFNINVRASIELSKDAAKSMAKAKWGRIIMSAPLAAKRHSFRA
jgi:short-subunit dehydrogenase